MRNLIDFIIKNSSWFIFVFLEIICFYFIFSSNSYQKSVFLNSSNEITGKLYSVTGGITSYFGLQSQNRDLLEKNAEYQAQVLSLKKLLHEVVADSMVIEAFLNDSLKRKKEYNFIIAQVVNNNVSMTHNYITISKGESDGIKPDMGVISQQGIVGVVRAVSDNFAVVLPVLNPDMKVSCKTLASNTTGILSWDGSDSRFANMMDYPKFEKFEKGDTIVTSGFSGTFPEGLLVGVVEDYKSQTNDNFYSLKVKLSTDFISLKDVIVIGSNMVQEQSLLEKRVRDAKK